MTAHHHCIRNTLLFGLICGLLFIPLRQMLTGIVPPPWADNLIIWLYLAGYGGLLIRRTGRHPLTLLWPLLPALIAAVTVPSARSCLLLCLGVLGWIRSGICDTGSQSKGLLTEIVLAFGAGALGALLAPRTPAGWAMGVWLFFVIQAFYFVIKDGTGSEAYPGGEMDPFESARAAAERILALG